MRDSKFRRALIWVIALFALSLALIPTIVQADDLAPVPTTEVPTTADPPVADSPPIADLSVENILLIAFAAVVVIIAVFGAVMRPVLVNAVKQAPEIAKVSFEAGYLEAERRVELLVKSTKTPVDDALAEQVKGYIRDILLEAGVLKPPTPPQSPN